MAKRDYTELLSQDITPISNSILWEISKDDTYYYKTLGEQNYMALDGIVEKNLEYMMTEDYHISGINPVIDMYYINDKFSTYRTQIVDGENIASLLKKWSCNFDCWKDFFDSFIPLLNCATNHNYCFPDLYTIGNFLYQEDTKKVTIIDNDGIQVEERFAHIYDYIAEDVYKSKFASSFFDKKEQCFTRNYNAFAFYSWFYLRFLHMRLSYYLGLDIQELKDALYHRGVHKNPWLWDTTMDFFSSNPYAFIDKELFDHLMQNYQIKSESVERKLVWR